MPEPTASSASGFALLKILGVQVGAGAIAAAAGFLVLWPRTLREAFTRFACSIFASALIGPFVVAGIHSRWPEVFSSAERLAATQGIEPAFGMLFVAGPIMVVTALPSWWVLGAFVRWFENRKKRDIGELIQDATSIIKDKTP